MNKKSVFSACIFVLVFFLFFSCKKSDDPIAAGPVHDENNIPYSNLGKLLSIETTYGFITKYEYDTEGRVMKKSDHNGYTIYTYNDSVIIESIYHNYNGSLTSTIDSIGADGLIKKSVEKTSDSCITIFTYAYEAGFLVLKTGTPSVKGMSCNSDPSTTTYSIQDENITNIKYNVPHTSHPPGFYRNYYDYTYSTKQGLPQLPETKFYGKGSKNLVATHRYGDYEASGPTYASTYTWDKKGNTYVVTQNDTSINYTSAKLYTIYTYEAL